MTTAIARRNPLASREHETMTLASGNDNKMLAIAQIRRDGQTQPRQGMNEDVVTDYVAALADNARFPAVDVMFDGVDYWLFDGFHRVESHLRSGRTEIEVRVHHGTLEQAQWRSYAANQSHGLRRSTADKERAIRAALQHKAAQGMSNEQVAKHLGVDPKTVSKYREVMRATLEIPESKIRTGADGRTYDVSNIGKRPNDDLREKSRKLEFWLLGKGWSFSSGPNSPNGAYKQGFPDLSWPKDDVGAGYEALRTAEKYERGQLTPPVIGTGPRPLSLDETIAVIWRVLKREIPYTSEAGARLAWLREHDKSASYTSALNEGVEFGNDTFWQAWARVGQELEGDIERAQLKAELNNSAYIALFATAIRRTIRAEGGPQAQWDFLIRYDAQDIYEALLSTELRGTLSPEIYRQARQIVMGEVKVAIHQEAAPRQQPAAPKPSVASQVIDLAERGMDAEVEAVLSVQPGGKRKAGIESMLALYASVLDSCEEFGKLTGRHTMTVSLCRVIEPMIAELRKNLA